MRHRIFVPLSDNPASLGESDAEPAGEGRFKLVGPQAQPLQFKRGEVVECDIQTLPNGSKGLVAVRTADVEFRKKRNIYGVLGTVVGATVGAAFGLMFVMSLNATMIGAGLGAVIFGYSSVRWGDEAWNTLKNLLWWNDTDL